MSIFKYYITNLYPDLFPMLDVQELNERSRFSIPESSWFQNCRANVGWNPGVEDGETDKILCLLL